MRPHPATIHSEFTDSPILNSPHPLPHFHEYLGPSMSTLGKKPNFLSQTMSTLGGKPHFFSQIARENPSALPPNPSTIAHPPRPQPHNSPATRCDQTLQTGKPVAGHPSPHTRNARLPPPPTKPSFSPQKSQRAQPAAACPTSIKPALPSLPHQNQFLDGLSVAPSAPAAAAMYF